MPRGRPCSVCNHPQANAINALLLSQARSLAEIAEEFSLKKPSLARHKVNHLNAVAPSRRDAKLKSIGKPPAPKQPVSSDAVARKRLDQLEGHELEWLDQLARSAIGDPIGPYGRALMHAHLRAEAKFGDVAKKAVEEDSFFTADRTFSAARGLTADLMSIAKTLDPKPNVTAVQMNVNLSAELLQIREQVSSALDHQGHLSLSKRAEAADIILVADTVAGDEE